MGRTITASATSTSAPMTRCLSPLSSRAISYSLPGRGPSGLTARLAEPDKGIGHTVEGSEHQHLVALPGSGALGFQRGSDGRELPDRYAPLAQRGAQCLRAARASGGQVGNGPVIHPVEQRNKHAVEVLVGQQAEYRQATTVQWFEPLRQVGGGMGIMGDIQQQ